MCPPPQGGTGGGLAPRAEPKPVGVIPPASAVPAILKLRAARANPEGFLKSLGGGQVDAASFRAGRRRFVFLNEPGLIQEVLLHQADKFRKTFVLGKTQRLLGESVFVSEGDLHRRQRRAVAPMVRHETLDPFIRLTHAAAVDLASGWPSEGTVDAYREMDALSLRVCLIHLFGVDDPAQEAILREALSVSADLYERASSPLRFALDRLPLPSTRRMDRQIAAIQGWVEERIRVAEGRPPDAGHILAQLLAYRFGDGGPSRMGRTEVRDEMVDLVVGMHGVVSMGLAFTILLLAGAPGVQQRIREEVAGALGPRAPALSQLRALPHTQRAVREALRMYAPAWAFTRMPTTDVTVGPYRIPKGSFVVISPAVTHRDARFFPEPDRYDPDRWAPPKLELQRKGAFIPFGVGPRSCLGEPLAVAEITTTVAAIVPRVELRPVMDHEPRRRQRFANVPDEPLPVGVRRLGREPAAD